MVSLREALKAAAATAILATALSVVGTGGGVASASPTDPYTENDVWVCRPGLADNPCELPVTTTDKTGFLSWGPNTVTNANRPAESQRPVDCFYIYPTIKGLTSLEEQAASRDVKDTARWQVGQFTPLCRMFAPAYRQTGVPPGVFDNNTTAQAYADVEAAWTHYMQYDNGGRGVIILGHSQGSLMLRELIHNVIDPDPAARSRLVGAFLLGGNVMVAANSTKGGDFTNIPICTAKGQYGCVVAYSTYATDPFFELFGNQYTDGLNGLPYAYAAKDKYFPNLPKGPGYQVACTDPGRLSGMSGPSAITVPYDNGVQHPVSTQGSLLPWVVGINPPAVSTPWVKAYQYSGGCRTIWGNTVFRYDPANLWSPRPYSLPMMGSHEIDMNLGVEKLVRIAQLQIQSWTATH